jgi:hypothetical protein
MTESTEKKYDDVIPIFRIKPVYRDSSCIVKHVGYIDNTKELLLDEIVDIKTSDFEIRRFGRNTEFVTTINNYDITAVIMRNNIKGDILLKGDYFPLYSLSIGFIKTLVSGYLFDIFVGFAPDQESLTQLKNPQKVVDARLNGSYTMKIYCDPFVSEHFDNLYDELDQKLIEEPHILEKIGQLDEKEGMDFIAEQLDEYKNMYKDLQNGYMIFEFKSHLEIINKLRDLYKSRKIFPLIKFVLEQVEKKRNKKYNAIESYEIPKNIIKLNDLEKNINNMENLLQ